MAEEKPYHRSTPYSLWFPAAGTAFFIYFQSYDSDCSFMRWEHLALSYCSSLNWSEGRKYPAVGKWSREDPVPATLGSLFEGQKGLERKEDELPKISKQFQGSPDSQSSLGGHHGPDTQRWKWNKILSLQLLTWATCLAGFWILYIYYMHLFI